MISLRASQFFRRRYFFLLFPLGTAFPSNDSRDERCGA